MSSFGNFFLLSPFFLTSIIFTPLNPWCATLLLSGFLPVPPQVPAAVTLCSVSLGSTQVRDKWLRIVARFDGSATCCCVCEMQNMKSQAFNTFLSLAKRSNNSSSRRLQSSQFSTRSRCGTVPFTLSICLTAYSPVLPVVSARISHERHVLAAFIVHLYAVASPLPSSGFSVLSDSSVLTVVAYYLSWNLLHLQPPKRCLRSFQDDSTVWNGKKAAWCLLWRWLCHATTSSFCIGCCLELRSSAGESQGSALFQPHRILPQWTKGWESAGSSCSREELNWGGAGTVLPPTDNPNPANPVEQSKADKWGSSWRWGHSSS